MLPLYVSGLHQSVLPLEVPVLYESLLMFVLDQSVFPLDVSGLQQLVLPLMFLAWNSLYHTWKCLSTVQHADKKENQIFLISKEIQSKAVDSHI